MVVSPSAGRRQKAYSIGKAAGNLSLSFFFLWRLADTLGMLGFKAALT